MLGRCKNWATAANSKSFRGTGSTDQGEDLCGESCKKKEGGRGRLRQKVNNHINNSFVSFVILGRVFVAELMKPEEEWSGWSRNPKTHPLLPGFIEPFFGVLNFYFIPRSIIDNSGALQCAGTSNPDMYKTNKCNLKHTACYLASLSSPSSS